MEYLIEFFRDKHVTRVLDVGTGTGDFVNELEKAFPEAEITGVDPNAESLKLARVQHFDVNFREMSAEKLKFKEDSFDVASISMALHHLPDVRQSLAEMQRVVKTGGWIIVAELFSDNLNEAQEAHKMYHHFRSKIDRLNGISHNATFKKDEILKMISDSGIEIQRHFEFKPVQNQGENPDASENRIQKMETMLATIKHLAEYDLMKPQIEDFREKVKKYGFQPATRIIVVGKNS